MTRRPWMWIACGAAAVLVSAASRPTQPATTTSRIVEAANAFLATLTADERQTVLFAFTDDTQRARWSNFPTGFVKRAGLDLRVMTDVQQVAVMNLLATVLSPEGVQKVNDIRGADEAFKATSGRGGARGGRGPGGARGGPPRGAGGPPDGNADDMFGKDLYYVSFLGQPSVATPWMLQFGGHHLALNITVAGPAGILTPTLTGAQPATYDASGRTVRPLGRENDKAVTLLQSLSADQRQKAVLTYRVGDLVLGPGQDGKTILPEGLRASDLNDHQRTLLTDLIGEWAGIINAEAAQTRMTQLRADLPDTYFAWSGPTTVTVGTNITAYYRIQGPHLVIEFAPQNDDPADHVHTMYRDPTNDYGRAVAGK